MVFALFVKSKKSWHFVFFFFYKLRIMFVIFWYITQLDRTSALRGTVWSFYRMWYTGGQVAAWLEDRKLPFAFSWPRNQGINVISILQYMKCLFLCCAHSLQQYFNLYVATSHYGLIRYFKIFHSIKSKTNNNTRSIRCIFFKRLKKNNISLLPPTAYCMALAWIDPP